MLIHPWDEAAPDEWRPWLADGRNFGQLVANGESWPVVVPTHFTVRNDRELVLHLARPNPIRAAIQDNPSVTVTVLDDYVYVPSTWRVLPGQPLGEGVPTSYYAAVQFECKATLIDDPDEKAAILSEQLSDVQPEGGYARVDSTDGPYHRLLPGIFGIHLEVVRVRAKFKYDDHKPAALREQISRHLDTRDTRHDSGARTRQQERLARADSENNGRRT